MFGRNMPEIGIGIVGGGYMGKAHSVAMAAVGAVFDTVLRPRLEMICARTPASAERYRAAYGFARATDDWVSLVSDARVDAIIIASPQTTHRAIAEAAFALGKPVLCEKPLGASLDDSRAMVAAAEKAGVANMVGFNYVRTPATQFARRLIAEGAIGDVNWFRGEHTEDFLADPDAPASWRTRGIANGVIGDLAPHIINAALALMGPIAEVVAELETVHATRRGREGPEAVTNDDHAQIMCRFARGAQGHLYFSRIATGRKMGYAYEVHGTKGSIRFEAPMLYALGFVCLFMIGGITGIWLAALAADVHLTDTYFVVAHFHFIMVGGSVMAFFAALHFWWPKITGRLYPDGWARAGAILMFVGFNLTFFPQYLLGILGMPRRYHTYPDEYQVLNVASSAGASILAVAYVLPLFYLWWSLRRGQLAGANPWQASGLEWKTPSPPPPDNFESPPRVDSAPYNYHAGQTDGR